MKKRTKHIPTGSVFQRTYRDRNGKLQRSACWTARYYVNGKPVQIATGTPDYDEALAMLRSKMADAARLPAHHDQLSRVYIGHVLDLLIQTYKFEGRRTLYDMEHRVEKHLRPAFGALKVEALTTGMIRRYAQDRAKDAAPATVNKELAYLRHALRLGKQEVPPLVDRMPHVPMLPVSNTRKGTLTHEQYKAVRDRLPEYARIALVIGYYTGARRGEIAGIRREHVDLAARRILLSQTKNGEARYLPIYGDMGPELDMWLSRMDRACPWLLQENGHRVLEFRKSWASACSGAGVPAALFHDLRRTAVTMMIEAGLSEQDAMAISGHKTRAMLDRYHIVSARRLREAGDKLAAHMQQKEKAARKAQKQGRLM